MRVHILQTGLLVGNETFLRGQAWSSLLRRRAALEFPVYSVLVEHREGPLLIDTGLTPRVRVPRLQRRFVPQPVPGSQRSIASQLRAAGIAPADVRRVVITHLDWDHAGGIGDLPHAEVLVHRPELDFAATRMGRLRYQPGLWPAGLAPTAYELDDGPFGPFPASRRLTADGTIVAVPLPGHSVGQVGVVVRSGDVSLLLAADHVLRQDWLLEDHEAGRLLGLGVFFPEHAAETTRRIWRYAEQTPTVLLPSHDAEAPARLAALETLPTGYTTPRTISASAISSSTTSSSAASRGPQTASGVRP